ncbi:hypothetical protein BKK49_11995 [Rodentibacter rarus]|uniref:hypothetical protein n=1 Tax=Rodentibacter rarus TaxID=1908260 RepID=UPI0009849ADB|nr:hypothetical protein [Rodentibacter rarus]OOF36102.1 hypothetical protein BKK49_11995 [Rodentibacter rarus]
MIEEIKYNITLEDIEPILSEISSEYNVSLEKDRGMYIFKFDEIFVPHAIAVELINGDVVSNFVMEIENVELELINRFNSEKMGHLPICLVEKCKLFSSKYYRIANGVSEYFFMQELLSFIFSVLFGLIPYLKENGIIPNEDEK